LIQSFIDFNGHLSYQGGRIIKEANSELVPWFLKG